MPDQPDVIEKYLDQVCGHLQMMPEDDVAEIRCELREHLQLSVDVIVAEGIDAEAAAGEAIRKFGPASRIGNRLLSTFPFVWTWDWEGYTAKSLPTAPVALRIYVFYGALLVSVSGPVAPLVAAGVAVLGLAAFGAAFESYRYIRDSFEIAARSPFARRGEPETRIKTAVRPSRLYRGLGLDRLPSTMHTCRLDELPSVMSSNIVTMLLASVIADVDLFHHHHSLATVLGVGFFVYAYILGAIACRAFLRYAARRPGQLFTFMEAADVEAV